MLKTIAFAAGLAIGSVTAAFAGPGDIGGHYTVAGTNADGSAYNGTADITVTSKNTCRITWDTGSTADGICMRNGIAFAAAYALGKDIGLIIYEIKPDGVLDGIWTLADKEGVGTEVLTPGQ